MRTYALFAISLLLYQTPAIGYPTTPRTMYEQHSVIQDIASVKSDIVRTSWRFNESEGEDLSNICFISTTIGKITVGLYAPIGQKESAYIQAENSIAPENVEWSYSNGTSFKLNGEINDYFGWIEFRCAIIIV